eukprot:jgi/Orpsp1_1/1184842/evm.model.c7180000091215.1
MYILFIEYSEGVELNAFAYSLDDTGNVYESYVNGFNKYAKENNIDIRIKLNLMTRKNFTLSIENSILMIESLLKKRNNKYDIYFYDNADIRKYYPYLLDLSQYLPEEHIDIYDKNIISQTCLYQDKLIGLPVTLITSALYSNKKLLNKYHKEIPKTWDQLISTGKEILEKEKLLNNTDIIGYNGLFSEPEEGICSIYEFIYSCRESYESPFPEIRSQTTIEAMKLIKKIKEEISSDEIFLLGTEYTEEMLHNGNALFLKFYVFVSEFKNDNFPYVISNLPGIKEGISSSIIAGYNIGIDSSIDKSKEESAIEVVKFMTSKEFQKSLALKKIIISGILSFYNDEEFCSKIKNCEYYRNLQVIARPVNKTKDFYDYTEKFTNYFYKFLYGNETAKNAIK